MASITAEQFAEYGRTIEARFTVTDGAVTNLREVVNEASGVVTTLRTEVTGVSSAVTNLQAAAGRVRASGIAVGASKRDAWRHLCQHVDDNEPIEWRELRTHVVRNTQIRAPRRSIHIIGYMLVLHRGC